MTRAERIIFASGEIFGGGSAGLVSVLYLIYLTDVVGIPPIWAGFAVLLPRIWDAINDPLMGLLSDNARTRWGRRRPFITVGASLLVVALAAAWAPIGGWESGGAKVAFIVAANLFYTTIATVVLVPLNSFSTEVTTNYQERNRINIMRLAFSSFSAAICSVIGTQMITAYARGELSAMSLYLTVVFGFGLLFALPLLLLAAVAKERAPIPVERSTYSIKTAIAPLKIASFRHLLTMYLTQALTMDVLSALIVYYSIYVVKLDVPLFLGIFLGVNLIGYLVANQLVKTVSKPLIYRALIPLAMLGALGIGLYPSDAPLWGVYLFAAMVAVGIAAGVLMSWVMFPDVIDDAELITGARNAGSFSGLMTLIRGLSTALAVQLIGLMLQLTGYEVPENYLDATQSASAQIGIRATMAGSVIVFLAIGWWAARRYPLDYARCQEMQRELAERRTAAATD